MPSAKYEIRRKCEECGAVFIAKTLESHYCSKACTQKAYNRRKADNKKREQMDAILSTVPNGRDYISVAEAEAMFGISGKTVRRMIKSGKVPAINLGERFTRVSKSALLSMVPLRETPIDRSKPLPKFYSMEPEDCLYNRRNIKEVWHQRQYGLCHIRKYSIPTRQIGNYVYAPKADIDNLYKDVVKL